MELLYSKECLGLDYEPIKIYKFRTMVVNAEEKLEEAVAKGLDGLGKPIDDPRITPFGRLLRKYWIDEYPQLYNLAKGELKLVGLRPKGKEIWNQYPDHVKRKAMEQKPGLMAIQYAYTNIRDFEENIDIIKEYINQWERDPVKTDRTYFSKIMQGILFKGVRSC